MFYFSTKKKHFNSFGRSFLVHSDIKEWGGGGGQQVNVGLLKLIDKKKSTNFHHSLQFIYKQKPKGVRRRAYSLHLKVRDFTLRRLDLAVRHIRAVIVFGYHYSPACCVPYCSVLYIFITMSACVTSMLVT